MKGPGSPAWRKAGRPAKGEMPVKAKVAPVDISDLAKLPDDELRTALGREALLTIASVMRKPARHAMAQLGAARDLAAFTVAKPAQATTVSAPDGGPVQSEHHIVFVEAEGK